MEFKRTTLSEISINNKGYYGINAPATDYSEDLPTYLRITDINDDGSLNKYNLKSVDDSNYEKFLLSKNDIVFARTGNSTGRNYYYDGSAGELVYAGFLIKFSLNEKMVYPKYIKYFCKTRKYWGWVDAISTGSTRKNINAKMYGEMPVLLPSHSNQIKIVKSLEVFDKRIEINNKIIENLEIQAQAIFKSWFVDFEPFQDGNFVESELGLIPEGWAVVKFGNLFKFQKGKKPKSFLDYGKEEGVPYIVKGVIDGSESPSYTLDEKIIKIENMDIFMLMDGANAGNIYYGYNGALGSTFSFLNIEDLEYREFIYWFLKSNENYIRNQNTGSAIPHANKDFINNIRFALPKNISKLNILNYFKVIRTKVITLKLENQTLAQTRDTLLPNLMSGEIDVSNIKIDDEDIDYE